jgi:hypothetical protein
MWYIYCGCNVNVALCNADVGWSKTANPSIKIVHVGSLIASATDGKNTSPLLEDTNGKKEYKGNVMKT